MVFFARLKPRGFIYPIVVLFLLFVPRVHASDSFSLLTLRPPASPSPFMLVEGGALNLKQWDFDAGTTVNYEWKPLDIGRIGGVVRSGVNNLLAEYFFGHVGFTDWLAAGLDMPVAWYYKYGSITNLRAPIGTHTSLGDGRITFKVKMVEEKRFAAALSGFVTFPSGKSDYFMGDGTATFTGLVSLDGLVYGPLRLGLNLGYFGRPYTKINDVVFDDQFLIAVAAAVKVAEGVNLVTEFQSRTPFRNFFKTQKNTPTFILQGVKWRPKGMDFELEAGGIFGILYGVGAPRAGGQAGFRYIFGRPEHAASRVPPSEVYTPPPAPVPIPKPVVTQPAPVSPPVVMPAPVVTPPAPPATAAPVITPPVREAPVAPPQPKAEVEKKPVSTPTKAKSPMGCDPTLSNKLIDMYGKCNP